MGDANASLKKLTYMNRYFVTFQTTKVSDFDEIGRPIFKTKKFVIQCNDEMDAKEVASDIYSIDGVKYLRISHTGGFKDRESIDRDVYAQVINKLI